jgi:hypothetical protein
MIFWPIFQQMQVRGILHNHVSLLLVLHLLFASALTAHRGPELVPDSSPAASLLRRDPTEGDTSVPMGAAPKARLYQAGHPQ